jgi:hypothetical protein
MGFMPGRFIAENGQILQNIQIIATQHKSSSIALCLDQEKGYDRVHPDYLSSIMKAFNVPHTLIHSITSLFFSTSIQVNVNGYLTQSIIQRRGLRQGDPLSPLLFNIAFDPFLRTVHNSPDIHGFDFHLESRPPPIPVTLSSSNPSTTPTPDSIPSIPLPTQPSTQNTLPPVKILAYADDSLVLLKNTSDFVGLQAIVSKYMSASNALLNYSKTQALSLSGATHPEWQTFLVSNGISTWHDKTASSPLIYLGYAICSSLAQRNQFTDQLLTKIRIACILQNQRNLSLRGRATVLNTLVYSTLWHVIRLITFTKVQLNSIQQIGAAFINSYRKMSRFSFSSITQPRHLGGLGVLDPITQQNALQWRWLRPLLLIQSQDSSHQFPSLPYLRFTLNHFLSTPLYPTYHWSFLFPSCRKSLADQPLSCLHNLLRASDAIPRNYHFSFTDASVCLRLPLSELLLHDISTSHPLYSSFQPPKAILSSSCFDLLIGNDILYYDPLTFSLKPRLNYIRHRNLTYQVTRLLDTRIFFQSFVYALIHTTSTTHNRIPSNSSTSPFHDTFSCSSLSSFIKTFISLPIQTFSSESKLVPPSIQGYKLLTYSNASNTNSEVSLQGWRSFWSLSIPLSARNTWYRIIHGKVNTTSFLHQRLVHLHPSPACPICSTENHQHIENLEHFIFGCSQKALIWSIILSSLVSSSFSSPTPPQLKAMLLLQTIPHRTQLEQFPTLSTLQIFAITLHAIWTAHWNFIYRSTPFRPASIITAITHACSTLENELNLD